MSIHLGRSSRFGAVRTLSRSSMALSAIAFAAMSTAPVAARQGGEAKPAEPQAPQTIVAFDCSGLSSMFVSPKDAAMARAFGMLPARLEELRQQEPEFNQVPRDVTDLLFAALSHPVRLAVTNKGFDPDTGMPGIGATLSFHMKDEQDSAAMGKAVSGVRGLAFAGAPVTESTRWKGMSELPLPFGVLTYGSRQAPDGWRYELLFGAVDSPDAPFAALPAGPKSVKPVFRGVLDLAAMTPFTQMLAGFIAMASPQGKGAVGEMRKRGILGPDAVAYELTQGYSDTASVNFMRVRRMGNFAEASGLSKNPLTAADLAIVPPDATAALVTRMATQTTWQQLRQQIETAAPGQFQQAMSQINEKLSIDFEQDVVAALGDTLALYVAESTGGGSILSGVAAISLAEPDRLAGALQKAAGAFNRMTADEVKAPGTIRIANFTQDGVRYMQLQFAGLPVPVQPTVAIAGSWLVVGATPAASVAAARHIVEAHRAGGLAANANFAKHRIDNAKPITIGFVDSARTMSRGYPLLSFATSLLSNAVRSSTPGVPERDPGFILPSYGELTRDVRPIVSMTYWDGEDMIVETTSDRSMLVNAAAVLGVGDLGQIVGSMLLGGGIGAGIASEMGGGRAQQWQPDAQPTDDDADDEAEGDSAPRRPSSY